MTNLENAKNIAHAVLKEFTEIAPYSSYNLAIIIQAATAAQAAYLNRSAFVENNKALINFCRSWASFLDSQFDAILSYHPKNYNHQTLYWYDLAIANGKNLPVGIEGTKREKWFKQALASERKMTNLFRRTSLVDSDKIIGKKQCLFDRTFINLYNAYLMVERSKTGNCSVLSCAGVAYIITQTDFNDNIILAFGVNVDHAVIIINCPEFPTEDFALETLPEGALVIDLWIRCKFLAKYAKEYYADLDALRNNRTDQKTPFKFRCERTFTPEQIKKNRENYKMCLQEYDSLQKKSTEVNDRLLGKI